MSPALGGRAYDEVACTAAARLVNAALKGEMMMPGFGNAWAAFVMGIALVLSLAGCGQSAATNNAAKPPAPETSSAEAVASRKPATRPATQPADTKTTRTAVLAGGCFWCVEAIFERIDGVEKVVSGFAGGSASTAVYHRVVRSTTQHAEAVHITYEPSKVSYGELLQIFFATHDPTQLNRQGPDTGPQYRSAIFYQTQAQQRIAEQYIDRLNKSDIFDREVVTTVEQLAGFYPADESHQDYAEENPDSDYIETYLPPKLEKLRKLFGEKLKE